MRTPPQSPGRRRMRRQASRLGVVSMAVAAALSVVGLNGGGQAFAGTPSCDVMTLHEVTFSNISWGPYEEGYVDNKDYPEQSRRQSR